MSRLTPDILRECADLLAPLLGTTLERRNLLDLAVGRLPVFETLAFEGPTGPFITDMANRVDDYGRLPDGTLALCQILLTASDQRGTEYRTRFETLIRGINTLHVEEASAAPDHPSSPVVSKSIPPRHVRLFISSPGDVPEERAIAAKVMEDLPHDPLLKGKMTTEVVAWDQPGSATPMLATMPPQEAINRGMPLPADCDLVVVIFWARMGTPLTAEYVKPNGARFQSGTEWEFLNAVDAEQASTRRGDNPGHPQIIIYRRTEDPMISFRDPKFDEKKDQWERLEAFFKAFTNPDGSIERGYNPYKTPDDFRQQFENHLKKLIGQLLDAPQSGTDRPDKEPKVWAGSPFPGLRAFTPDDEPIFYGRGAETDALVEQVRASHFVTVVGASGSGKSSLVGAGLLPRLVKNAVTGSKDWIIPGRAGDQTNRAWVGLRFTPGEVGTDPFMALALRLAPMIGRVPRDLATELADKPESLPSVIQPLLAGKPSWAEALLFIDQFEELFTLVDLNKREPFIQMLKAAADSPKLRVVLTLRADFYVRCAENLTLSDLLKTGTFPLAAPGTAALYEMIARPSERAGLRFENGLIDLILRETGDDPGALALLAYLLDELYKQRTRDGRLTVAAYRELGGVQGAIGKRAEETVNALKPEQLDALPTLFREIVEVDARGEPTRRRADLTRLLTDPTVATLIDKLTDARLLVRDEGAGHQPIVEVAHEALLRQWPRLQIWIASAEADLRLRRQVEQAAHDWQNASAEKKDEFLWFGGRLDDALQWLSYFPAGDTERQFIEASRQKVAQEAADKERKRQQELESAKQLAEAGQRATRILLIIRRYVVGAIGFGTGMCLVIFLLYSDTVNSNPSGNILNTVGLSIMLGALMGFSIVAAIEPTQAPIWSRPTRCVLAWGCGAIGYAFVWIIFDQLTSVTYYVDWLFVSGLIFSAGFAIPAGLRAPESPRVLTARELAARVLAAMVGVFLALYFPWKLTGKAAPLYFLAARGDVSFTASLLLAVVISLFTFSPELWTYITHRSNPQSS